MGTIYLVRHGETTSNLKRTWRTPDEDLTETGMEQARLVGERVKSLQVSNIIASTAARTMKTAELISEVTGITFEGNKLFYEEKSPSSIMGLVHEKTDDNQIEQYLKAALEHSEEPEYRYENEENLWELKERIKKIFDFFDAHKNDELLIVTHGNIMKMIVAHIVLGNEYSAKELYLGSQKFKTTNTGITKLVNEEGMWRILIWNDTAHFAE